MMDKLCEPIILGLIFDVVGFLLVFLFGGFDLGRSALLLQGDHSKPLKIIGAILVLIGFALQIYGNL